MNAASELLEFIVITTFDIGTKIFGHLKSALK